MSESIEEQEPVNEEPAPEPVDRSDGYGVEPSGDPVADPDLEPIATEPEAEPGAESSAVPEAELQAAERAAAVEAETAGDEAASRERRRGFSARSILGIAGRTTTGIVTAAIAAAVVVLAAFIVPPAWSRPVEPLVIAPVPAPQTLVCPGGLLRLADTSGAGASNASPVGAPRVEWAVEGGGVRTDKVSATNAGTLDTDSAAEIATVTSHDDELAAVAGGFQTELLIADPRGLATATCSGASSDQWVVGGATTLGRTSLLVLTNPSEVEAVVRLELYGERGAVAAAGLEGIRLGPGEQRVLPLNGFALDLAAPVVHVTSTGGRVVASVQQTITRTLTPGGSDISGAQTPSGELVIPGVRVTPRDALAPIDVSETDHADVDPVLRLLLPSGAAGITAEVSWIANGSTLEGAVASQVQLTPGVVTELPMSGLVAGDYTVVVRAPEAILGAVRTSVIADASLGEASLAGGVDFAWFQPAAPLGDRAVITVPEVAAPSIAGPSEDAPINPITGQPFSDVTPIVGSPSAAADAVSAAVWIANPSDESASVVLTVEGASPQTFELEPGGARFVGVEPGKRIDLAGVEGLSAAIVSAGPGLISQSPLRPPASGSSPARIHY